MPVSVIPIPMVPRTVELIVIETGQSVIHTVVIKVGTLPRQKGSMMGRRDRGDIPCMMVGEEIVVRQTRGVDRMMPDGVCCICVTRAGVTRVVGKELGTLM